MYQVIILLRGGSIIHNGGKQEEFVVYSKLEYPRMNTLLNTIALLVALLAAAEAKPKVGENFRI